MGHLWDIWDRRGISNSARLRVITDEAATLVDPLAKARAAWLGGGGWSGSPWLD